MRTPWGKAQTVTTVAPGIVVVDTAGHGGVKLDRKRNAKIPMAARLHGGWYEEDCEALIPLLVFYDEMKSTIAPSATRAKLAESLRRWLPESLNALVEAKLVEA